MLTEVSFPSDTGSMLARFRNLLEATQAQLAQLSGVEQSRISRIEKNEIAPATEIRRLLEALSDMGSADAKRYAEYVQRIWTRLETPSFLNPQLSSLELADETLDQVGQFLAEDDRPWPLMRQIERQRDALEGAAGYLQTLTHQIAFIGDVGVGKSTAISFLLSLLAPQSAEGGPLDRVVLETGGGRTTVCEVHIRRGPDYGVVVQPQTDSEVRALVSDFCSGIWQRLSREGTEGDEPAQVSEEVGRAIRNMAGLTVKRERQPDGRRTSRDLAIELAKACESEDEFRARVIDRMQLSQRTRRELWCDQALGKTPLHWMTDIFKAANNGRLADVSLPRSIDLLIPDFAEDFAPIDVSIVDTKGVDDVAVRPDLDARLKDPRTLVVLCTSFNDAPSTTAQILLEHLGKSFGERIDSGRIVILVLPRPGEAMKVKDDSGNFAEDDTDGYDLKRDQINRTLGAEKNLSGVPILFFNAAADDPSAVRSQLFNQLNAMRRVYADRLLDLSATVDDLIKNHEAQAVSAAVEEVASRLRYFLASHRKLNIREQHAYQEVLLRLNTIRHASTLWAATRRNGEWNSFDVCHHIGVGAAQDALIRSRDWFFQLKSHLDTMRHDPGLVLARRLIDQIERSLDSWRKSFAEAARIAGSEVYREHIQQDQRLWSSCAGEWGRGSGFKVRVAGSLKEWFERRTDLKDGLEQLMNSLWDDTVIRSLERLCEENAAETDNPA